MDQVVEVLKRPVIDSPEVIGIQKPTQETASIASPEGETHTVLANFW